MPDPAYILEKPASLKQINFALKPPLWKELVSYGIYFVTILLLVSTFYIFIRFFAFDTIEVQGESMYPYHSTGDMIYIDLLTPRFSSYRRGEIVVLKSPKSCDAKDELFIKRIIGLPHEKVIFENGDVYIQNSGLNSLPIRLDESAYLDKNVKTYKNVTPSSVDTGKTYEEKLLGDNEYYFMGDNRPGSMDGRRCGPIAKDQILGKEFYRFQPADRRGSYKLPKYNIPNL